MPFKPLKISITGGAKSGKTTIMKYIAKYLGIYALSTGDMFRCHAYIWINSKLPPTDIAGRLKEIKNAYIYFGQGYNYFYKQKKITEAIDNFEMSSITCQLAQNPEFRKIVKDKITKIIRKHRQIVVEGRDTGTKILGDADIKIWMDHEYESRARNVKKEENKEMLIRLLKWRDSQDADRPLDPFVKPSDAIAFNNSYIDKVTASQLLLQNVIIPKLNELNISTNNFTCDADIGKVNTKEQPKKVAKKEIKKEQPKQAPAPQPKKEKPNITIPQANIKPQVITVVKTERASFDKLQSIADKNIKVPLPGKKEK